MNSKLNLLIERLEKKHNRKSFINPHASLQHYLREQASQDERRLLAVTYVLTQVPSADVLGYYTLSNFALELAELPSALAAKLPYRQLPAILIGRLAVHTQKMGKGLGGLLLVDAFYRICENSQMSGVYAVVVDTIDEAARSFYRRYGFLACEKTEEMYMLPVATLKKQISASNTSRHA